jgi:hypothetical protein
MRTACGLAVVGEPLASLLEGGLDLEFGLADAGR